MPGHTAIKYTDKIVEGFSLLVSLHQDGYDHRKIYLKVWGLSSIADQ
jgi:hypothetical protein